MKTEKNQHLACPRNNDCKDTRHSILVLIVDDEKSVLNALKRSLADEDFDVVTTDCPTEALRLFSQSCFSVIISDYQMPTMSGADLLGEIKRMDPRCIRIMLTGATDAESVPEAIAKNILFCDKFLTKPWDDYLLIKTVRESIAKYDLLADTTSNRSSRDHSRV